MTTIKEGSQPLGRLRAALGLDSDVMAALLGVPPGTYVAYERGAAELSSEQDAVIASLAPRLDLFERAREELRTVKALHEGVETKIQTFVKARPEHFSTNRETSVALHSHLQRSVDGDLVLLRQAYGRVVRVRDLQNQSDKTYRIAWGSSSWPGLSVFPRNSPVIHRLMSAREGQIVEVQTPKGEREYEILEVSLLWRHPPESLLGNYDNFQRLEYALDPQARARSHAEELRTWLLAERDGLCEAVAASVVHVPPEETAPQPLTADSRTSLSDRFFMNPEAAQEDVMREAPEGHFLVEGVAGSGKTSVALGRSAHLFMQQLEEGDVTEFVASNAIGFVLSDQLVGYLERLIRDGRLNLEKMQIKSYFRLRQELLGPAGRALLVKGVRRSDVDGQDDDRIVGSLAWVEAVEQAMVHTISAALAAGVPADPRDALSRASPLVKAQHWEALAQPWEELVRSLPQAVIGPRGPAAPQLRGSLQRVDEVRGVFADRLEHLSPWDTPRFREDRRRLNERLRDAVKGAFEYATRYFEVVLGEGFPASVARAVRQAGHDADDEAIAHAVEQARQRARNRQLSNGDIDCLLLLAHNASVGYVGRDGTRPIEHLGERPYRIHVFIDEVQDFSEVQVRLMAAQADPRFNSVTAVGDFAQRLSARGIGSLARSGLSLRGDRTMFLAWNKRQRAPLHAFSYAYRVQVQGDARPCEGEPPGPGDERAFLVGVGENDTAEGLRRALISTREERPHYSMAVLCPSGRRARELEAQVRHELSQLDILTRVSDGDEAARLCDAYYVHFTTPLEAKGLEFDAVFLADADLYDLGKPTDRAALYVALSRARHRLGIAVTRPVDGALGALFDLHVETEPPFSTPAGA